MSAPAKAASAHPTILVLGTLNPEAQHIGGVDFARWLEYGGGRVLRLDPEDAYHRGGMAGLESAVLKLVDEQRVEILLYPLGMEFDFRPAFFRETLAHVFKVLLLGDDEHFFDVSHRYYAQCFDLVLTINPLCDRFALYGTEAWFIPGVFSPTVFSPESDPRKEIDVSFIGAMRGKVGREQYADALAKAGIDLRVYGAGTPAGVVTEPQVIEIYRRSRINLNFTGSSLATPLDADLSINRRVRQVKGRCSKIALCGSFVLSEYAPGIEKLFDIGSEIDVFHDEDELVEKVRFYLTHEDKREKMAAKAYARAVEQYDEAKFGRQLARAIESRAAENHQHACSTAIFFDKPFWSAFGAWRFKYLVMFLFSGSPGLFLRELALLLRTGRFKPYAAFWFAVMGLQASSRTSRLATWMRRAARRLRRMVSVTG